MLLKALDQGNCKYKQFHGPGEVLMSGLSEEAREYIRQQGREWARNNPDPAHLVQQPPPLLPLRLTVGTEVPRIKPSNKEVLIDAAPRGPERASRRRVRLVLLDHGPGRLNGLPSAARNLPRFPGTVGGLPLRPSPTLAFLTATSSLIVPHTGPGQGPTTDTLLQRLSSRYARVTRVVTGVPTFPPLRAQKTAGNPAAVNNRYARSHAPKAMGSGKGCGKEWS